MSERPSFLSAIVELQLSTREELEEALVRQLIYGGDLPTSILELGLLTERGLLDSLALSSGLASSSAPHVVSPADTALLTERGYRALCRRALDGHDIVTISDPKTHEQASFTGLLGQGVQLEIALAFRIEEALSHLSGNPADTRTRGLIERLGSRPPLLVEPEAVVPQPPRAQIVSVAAAPEPAEPELPQPMPVERTEYDQASPEIGITEPPPLNYAQITAEAAGDEPAAVTQPRPKQSFAPDALERTRHGLLTARDRDAIFEHVLEGVARYFEYAALFAISGNEARGLISRGQGMQSTELSGLRIPLDLSSPFQKTVEAGVYQLARLRASGLEGGIAQDLRRPTGRRVLLLPIVLRGRSVMLLWGDQGLADVEPSNVGDIIALGPAVAAAFERVLLERKRASIIPQNAGAIAHFTGLLNQQAPAPSFPASTTAQPATISLASEYTPGPVEEAAAASPENRLDPRSASSPSDEANQHVDTKRIAAAPEARQQTAPPPELPPSKPSSHEVAPNATRTLDGDPHFPSDGPRTLKGFPGSPLPPNVAPDAPAPPVITRAISEPPTPSLAMTPRRIVPLDSTNTGRQAPHDLAAQEAPAPFVLPAEIRSTGTLVSRRPLVDEPPEDGWGTTFSPIPSRRPGGPRSYEQLVERLCAGEDQALERLVDGGESAVASLIARFPGPVREPAGPQAKASDSGPLLLALVRLGAKSTPFLTVRTADEDAEVRRWATLVLGEIPSRDSAKAIARRLLDSAPQVRRAALASARRLQIDVLARRTLRSQIEELALDVKLGTEARCAAIEAIADIREHEALPTLLQILGDKDRSVSRASQWALSVLTRQDFGSDFGAWQSFWQEHRNEHRVEWLIAALSHDKPDLRRAAYEELKGITGQDFGFQEDLPAEERSEIQALIRTWWTRNENKR